MSYTYPQFEGLKRLIKQVAREEMDITPVPVVGFKRLRPEENDNPLPTYQTPKAVGMDLQACLPEMESNCGYCNPVLACHQPLTKREQCSRCNFTGQIKTRAITLQGNSRRLISTGFALKLPPGYEAQVRSRSGLSLKEGIIVLNSPGTIDEDYTGEIGVILFNTTDRDFVIEHGQRIAQLVISPVVRAATQEVQELPVTVRGEGGFGSTGA